jgi:hypothetical protein
MMHSVLRSAYHKSYNPTLRFENFGWGRAENAKIHYAFVDPANSTIPGSFNESRAIGAIDKIATVSFENDLKALSVDTGKLARYSKVCGAVTDGSCRDGFECKLGDDWAR